jgi:hypothetical protein
VTPPFRPGIELSRLFYAEAVRPLLDAEFPGLVHSAALIGWGSDVLGFDSPRSTDHNWGPRLQLFLADDDAGQALAVSEMLGVRLPATFRGYPTVFAASGVQAQPHGHWVEVAGLRGWLQRVLGFDPTGPVELLDWLSVPAQALAEVTGGAVFHDGLRTADGDKRALTAVRSALSWYPHDIWLYVLACQWQRIAQEEAFPARAAEAGDDLGSAVVAARLVRDLMRLVLLMQRHYPPYSKWLGSAVARTPAARELLPPLTEAMAARNWPDRQRGLSAAYEAAARLHNALSITAPLDPAVRPAYYDRPYEVPGAGRFARALRDQVADERVRALPLTGAVDQFIDSTDAAGSQPVVRAAVAAAIEPG